MSAVDAAISLAIAAMRADSVLSLPNGTGAGKHPAGVKREVHPGSSESESTFPAGTTFPAIAVVPVSSENTLNGSGTPVLTSGLVMVKIVATGGNMETERRIAERVIVVLRSIKRATWTRGDGEPVYYVSELAWQREVTQPNETIGDRVFRFKNLVYRTQGYQRGG